MRRFINFCIFVTGITFSTLGAECESFEQFSQCQECEKSEDAYKGVRGKVDIAPAYVHIDLLQSGKTTHRLDLPGVKADCYYRIWQGLVIKPSILYTHGKGNKQVITGGVGVGFCIPCRECACITPVVGCNWGNMKTRATISPIPGVKITDVNHKFRSVSPYIGLEGSYTFFKGWRVVATYQYSWSKTHTTLSKGEQYFMPAILQKFKEHSKGSSYALMLEHDLNEQWSINMGGAYNCSLSKEKHGLRGYGFKLGLARWF